MWSSDRRAFLALAALGLAVAGCGFRPLYLQDDQDGGVLAEFAAVRVAPIEDRVGQELRNHLLDLMTPRGQPAAPKYVLRVELSESIQELAVEETAIATRANLLLRAEYRLFDAAVRESVTRGAVSTVSSYNLLDSDFATLAAENDARSRAAERLAREIRTGLGVFFAGRRKPGAS